MWGIWPRSSKYVQYSSRRTLGNRDLALRACYTALFFLQQKSYTAPICLCFVSDHGRSQWNRAHALYTIYFRHVCTLWGKKRSSMFFDWLDWVRAGVAIAASTRLINHGPTTASRSLSVRLNGSPLRDATQTDPKSTNTWRQRPRKEKTLSAHTLARPCTGAVCCSAPQ
jgi:hypothetical protein